VAGVSVDLFKDLILEKEGGSVSEIAHILRGVGTMLNKRFQFGDRRHNKDMPRVPFKDSNGATIKECRRKYLDRRIGNIQVEWIDEIVIR